VIAGSAVRVASQYGLDDAAIEDLIQEIYLKLCEKNCRVLREFQCERSDAIFAFLKIVASNYVRDRRKAMLPASSWPRTRSGENPFLRLSASIQHAVSNKSFRSPASNHARL
jgi:hypothetical protein